MHIDTGSGLELTVVAPGVVRGHRSHVSTHIFLPSTCPFPLLVYRQWFCGKIVYGLVHLLCTLTLKSILPLIVEE